RAGRRGNSRKPVLPNCDEGRRHIHRPATESGYVHDSTPRREGREAEILHEIEFARVRIHEQFAHAVVQGQAERAGTVGSDQLSLFFERAGQLMKHTIISRALFLILIAAASLPAQVSNERIAQAGQEPQNWLTHHGNYNSQRYSALSQIAPENVKNLEVQWIFQ